MNEIEAFERLGLPLTASEDEITARFRQLSHNAHPDTGGDDATMKELLLAYNTAMATFRNRRLVPVTAVTDIVRETIGNIVERQERRELTRKIVAQVVRHHASRFKQYKRISALFAVVAAGIAVISSGVLPIFDSLIMMTAFAILAVAIGLYYLMFSAMADNILYAIEDSSDTLDDRSSYVDLIYEIAGESDVSLFWTRQELESLAQKWVHGLTSHEELLFLFPFSLGPTSIRSLARRIGISEFIRLIISKGIEHEILQEHETLVDGRLLVQYYFTIAPAKAAESQKDESS